MIFHDLRWIILKLPNHLQFILKAIKSEIFDIPDSIALISQTFHFSIKLMVFISETKSIKEFYNWS